MTSKARQYSESTVKRLHLLSGNQCALPDCTRCLVARDGETVVSKICHIEAASPGGARWNPDMTDDERRHFSNLILLCDECHSIVDNKDNEDKFPVALLKEWKFQHESQMTYSLLDKDPSYLSRVIDAISRTSFDDREDPEGIEPYEIGDKIEYNCVKRNRPLIEEYKVFYTKVNSLYQTLEQQGSFKKDNLLRNIRRMYVEIKGKYVGDSSNPLRVVRENADSIIEDVQDHLLAFAKSATMNVAEDVSFGVSIIMVDAFMRCKILEAPST